MAYKGKYMQISVVAPKNVKILSSGANIIYHQKLYHLYEPIGPIPEGIPSSYKFLPSHNQGVAYEY